MNTLLHREGGEEIDTARGNGEREINLGTMTILLIFFGLAVLCAVFFGFGYSMGRKASGPTPINTAATPSSSTGFSGFKPAAGNAAGTPDPDAAKPAAGALVTVPYTPPQAAAESPVSSKVTAADGEVVGDPANADEAKPARAAAAVAMPVASGSGTIVVQIAAVTHQEDADMVATALKRRGYAVTVRNEPQDALLHVQVGPFATRKDADAMKQRLGGDGFNAIIKDGGAH